MNAPTLPTHQPAAPRIQTLVSVVVSTIDQHGDPGFVHSRGFHSPTVAARFALTQSVLVAELRGSPAVAVTITNTESASADTDVCVIGTPGEIACALAVHPLYAHGVRRAELQAPNVVYSAAREAAATAATASSGGADDDTFVEVVVRSVRPNPLPDSALTVGEFSRPTAHAVAHELVRLLGEHSSAEVVPLVEQGRVMVVHRVTLSALDAAAVQRYSRITRLRANRAALDPTVDAPRIEALTFELAPLLAHSHIALAGPDGVLAT